MTWFAVDDYFPAHRKVMALRGWDPERALCAIGLWTLAGAWAQSDTHGRGNGEVPSYVLESLAPGSWDELSKGLAAAGLWLPTDSGYRFHDWDDWNGPDAQSHRIEKRRAQDRDRQQNARRRRCEAGQHTADCPPDTCPAKLEKRATS